MTCIPHLAAHRLAPHAAPRRLASSVRGSTAGKQHGGSTAGQQHGVLFRARGTLLHACACTKQSEQPYPSDPREERLDREQMCRTTRTRRIHVQLLCQCLASALVLQTVDLIVPVLLVKGSSGAPSVRVLAKRHSPYRVFDSTAVEAANANGVACRERAPSRRQLWEGDPWQWRQGPAL